MGLVFCPDDDEPTHEDFRLMRPHRQGVTPVVTFRSWGEIISYLRENDWPRACQPWVFDGRKIVFPETVRGYLPE